MSEASALNADMQQDGNQENPLEVEEEAEEEDAVAQAEDTVRDDSSDVDISGAAAPDHAERDPDDADATRAVKSRDLLSRHVRQVKEAHSKLHKLIDGHTAEEFQQQHNKAFSPGAVSFVISPVGAIDFRASSWLHAIPLVNKYVKRLIWAVHTTIQEVAQVKEFDATEEDLGDVDKDSLPPQFAASLNNSRKNEYSFLMKQAALSVVTHVKAQLNISKTKFCEAKKTCTPDHDICKHQKREWKWAPNLPFLHTTYMDQGQHLTLCLHYISLSLVPPGFKLPTQAEHPRYMMLSLFALHRVCSRY